METFNEAINSHIPVLVDFYATWCGPCKSMHPVLENLKQQLGDKIRIIKIDIDKKPDLVAAYNIQSVPTLMVFRDGEQLWRQSGAMPLSELRALLTPML